MIEKLKPDQIIGLDGLPTTIMPDSAKLMSKINQIIEAITPILEERESGIKVCEEAHNMFNDATDEEPVCPFCNKKLFYADEIDGGFDILTCNCPHGIWLFGNDKMWYTLGRLKKQLETKKE